MFALTAGLPCWLQLCLRCRNYQRNTKQIKARMSQGQTTLEEGFYCGPCCTSTEVTEMKRNYFWQVYSERPSKPTKQTAGADGRRQATNTMPGPEINLLLLPTAPADCSCRLSLDYAPALRTPVFFCRRFSTMLQSILEKKASMYFGRSAGL